MKKHMTVLMMAAAALVVSTVPAAAANVRVKVPFAFEAGQKTLPAGTYEVSQPAFGGTLSVWNVEENRTILTNTIPAGNPNEVRPAALVFERSGDSYRLSEVRMPGTRTLGIPGGKKQPLVAQQGPVETVVVAAGQ